MSDDIGMLRSWIMKFPAVNVEALAALERIVAERDSLRKALERAKAALTDAINEYEDNSHYKSEYLQEKHGDVAEIARLRSVLSELSAAAPSQQHGIFRDHSCWKCKDGKEPCVVGNPNHCEYPHARND